MSADDNSPEISTPDDRTDTTKTSVSEFERQAEEAPPGLIEEFVDFLLHNKKWWLTPIILVLLMTATLIWLSGTVAGPLAPFIYTIF
jgi:hypothetical protein